jgi:2-polyprenyl-3-methyl-5-hydroxy-6-metoxy-1,4-benzoquinol methylase
MIKKIAKRTLNKLKKMFFFRSSRFDATGERVDILYNNQTNYEAFDMFQKSHYRRYEFALKVIDKGDVCGDFACGTGYGSVMLAEKGRQITGADLNEKVIKAIKKRYKKIKNVEFIQANLLDLSFNNSFDAVISFETLEHFSEHNISRLLMVYNKALKPGGKLIISTPYLQERNEAALQLGHHLTFYINEPMIAGWLTNTGFKVDCFNYQNYATHSIAPVLGDKDFIICLAHKEG